MSLKEDNLEPENKTTKKVTKKAAKKATKRTTKKITKRTPKKAQPAVSEDEKDNSPAPTDAPPPADDPMKALEDLLTGGAGGDQLKYLMLPPAPAAKSAADIRAVTMIGNLTEEKGSDVLKGMITLFETSEEQYYVDPMDLRSEVSTRRKPFDFYISTYGGSAHDMCGIYDMMKFCQSQGCEIETIGMGKIMSAGVPLLAAGTKGKRCIGKNAIVMIHGVQGGVMGPLHETTNELEQIAKIQDKYVDLIVANTKLTKKKMKKLLNKKVNIYFTAEEALKHGIVDIILDD